jgi:hypothetical protein
MHNTLQQPKQFHCGSTVYLKKNLFEEGVLSLVRYVNIRYENIDSAVLTYGQEPVHVDMRMCVRQFASHRVS